MKKNIIALAIGIMILFSGVALALDSFKFQREFAGDQTFAIQKGYVNNYQLVASTLKTVTVPTGARYAIFSATADIWVRIGAAAAIPAGDVTDGTGSELNPSIRWIQSETSIGVISAYAAKVSITFYK